MNRKVENFKKAFQRLKEASEKAKTDIEIDGTIQRFEFTFELAWKAIKYILEQEGLQCYSPKNCLKEAFSANLIENERTWLNMLGDRNLSVHIYDEKISREIFERIKTLYITEFEFILEKMLRY
jgi:nucleotidyltransferase substrate binding protein (TIGR01987 family)